MSEKFLSCPLCKEPPYVEGRECACENKTCALWEVFMPVGAWEALPRQSKAAREVANLARGGAAVTAALTTCETSAAIIGIFEEIVERVESVALPSQSAVVQEVAAELVALASDTGGRDSVAFETAKTIRQLADRLAAAEPRQSGTAKELAAEMKRWATAPNWRTDGFVSVGREQLLDIAARVARIAEPDVPGEVWVKDDDDPYNNGQDRFACLYLHQTRIAVLDDLASESIHKNAPQLFRDGPPSISVHGAAGKPETASYTPERRSGAAVPQRCGCISGVLPTHTESGKYECRCGQWEVFEWGGRWTWRRVTDKPAATDTCSGCGETLEPTAARYGECCPQGGDGPTACEVCGGDVPLDGPFRICGVCRVRLAGGDSDCDSCEKLEKVLEECHDALERMWTQWSTALLSCLNADDKRLGSARADLERLCEQVKTWEKDAHYWEDSFEAQAVDLDLVTRKLRVTEGRLSTVASVTTRAEARIAELSTEVDQLTKWGDALSTELSNDCGDHAADLHRAEVRIVELETQNRVLEERADELERQRAYCTGMDLQCAELEQVASERDAALEQSDSSKHLAYSLEHKLRIVSEQRTDLIAERDQFKKLDSDINSKQVAELITDVEHWKDRYDAKKAEAEMNNDRLMEALADVEAHKAAFAAAEMAREAAEDARYEAFGKVKRLREGIERVCRRYDGAEFLKSSLRGILDEE